MRRVLTVDAPLCRSRRRALAAVAFLAAELGRPPSLRQITERIGWCSAGGVFNQLIRPLIAAGYLLYSGRRTLRLARPLTWKIVEVPDAGTACTG